MYRRLLSAACALACTASITHALPAQAQLLSSSTLPALSSGSSALFNATPASPENDARHTIASGGITRSYLLEAPSEPNVAQAYPVVFVFGGWNQSAATTHAGVKLEDYLGSEALIVYGEGVDNAWGGAPYAKTSVLDDAQYIRDVLDDLSATYTIDRNRVFAAGLSNGGGLALGLACHTPDLVAGVVSVAGAFYNPTATNCTPGAVPTLILHGTKDGLLSYEGGTRHGAPYQSVDQVLTTMGEKNSCDLATRSATEQDNTTVFTFDNCRAETQAIRVNGGVHTWFTTPHASRLTADFVRRH